MGSRNLAFAIANGAPLTGDGFRVLIYMAWHSLDAANERQPGRVYTKGWPPIAEVVFAGRDAATAKKATQRAIAELIRREMIKPIGKAHRGQRQHYELLV